MTGIRLTFLFITAVTAASCGVPLMKLPTGPGVPAPDARAALEQATAACRRATTLTTEISVRGSVSGHRVRARLLAGFRAPASARLEAVAPFGAPLFILVADGPDATLLLPRDNRVLEHGSTAAVLEAIAGVPLDGGQLRMAVTGCTLTADAREGRQVGDKWLVVPDGSADIYLQRAAVDRPWIVAAAVHRDGPAGEWRAEYRRTIDGLPRSIRLASADTRFDLQLGLSQVEVDAPIEADAFRVRIPPSAAPITLTELRDAGPLGAASGR